MPKLIPFDGLARRFLRRSTSLVADVGPAGAGAGIDVKGLAQEMAQYDANIRDRLRRAALKAIDEELAKIRAERNS